MLVKLAVLAVACTTVLAGSAEARPTNRFITLGQSIGSVRLGMTQAQVRQILGPGTPLGSPYNHRLTVNYPKPGLYVQYGDGKAVGIVTSNPAYTTTKGIGVGRSTEAEVQGAYPAAQCLSSNGNYSCELKGASVGPGIARFTAFACSQDGQHDVVSIAVGYGKA